LIERLPQQRIEAQTNVIKVQDKQKKYHDQHINPHDYQISNKVLLFNARLYTKGISQKKLEEQFTGPFYIHNKFNNSTYQL
ncbi:12781_t:CDS:1, partial [Racocetra fulgida]